MKIAMIEDDKTISFAVQTFLKRYDMETEVFGNLTMTEKIDFNEFDLIILDVNFPDGSGFDYLKWLREFSNIPVIMLTVKNTDENILRGFEFGADEYITKPFSLPILKARIDNIFRRKNVKSTDIVFGDLSLNIKSMTAYLSGDNLELSKQEFSVLEILLENRGANVIRKRIIDSVWGYDLYEVNDNTLTVTIKRLRYKLGNYGKYIKTVRGIGYMWEDKNYED
ncbi:MAG: response regulator transcription factor [Peptostreptococcus stomatis]|uniref:response regulator transcription factor n=1 Tax=Peptostreptococcus stomatis TaxID=341694 RepID=UPI001A48C983|nr:response regulator transcription factor [Peptostreptococcus stomatis]MBL6466010.1 response regulator transcription factor [Peptostreptococcus stomatis]